MVYEAEPKAITTREQAVPSAPFVVVRQLAVWVSGLLCFEPLFVPTSHPAILSEVYPSLKPSRQQRLKVAATVMLS